MTSVLPKFTDGPVTFAALEPIDGGQVVEYREGGVGVAAAESTKVAGVAQQKAHPDGDKPRTTDPDTGVLDTSLLPSTVSVFLVERGQTLPVTYAAAAVHGDLLVAAAGGQVAPAGATDFARKVVGVCAEPGGVAAGEVGMVRLGR